MSTGSTVQEVLAIPISGHTKNRLGWRLGSTLIRIGVMLRK